MPGEQQLDWQQWHREYDDPNSRLARRLATVQQRLREALEARTGPVRLISMCAGEGRDVIPVLAAHPRRDDVEALLVELDPRNAEAAEAGISAAGLANVRVLRADAALTDNYADAGPADVILACGIFGNISLDDIKRTVEHLPMLAAPGATVLWTRGRWKDNDPTPQIRQWFTESGFEELSYDAPDEWTYSVGANRLIGQPRPLERGLTLFSFLR
jgi:hypothetical protein